MVFLTFPSSKQGLIRRMLHAISGEATEQCFRIRRALFEGSCGIDNVIIIVVSAPSEAERYSSQNLTKVRVTTSLVRNFPRAQVTYWLKRKERSGQALRK